MDGDSSPNSIPDSRGLRTAAADRAMRHIDMRRRSVTVSLLAVLGVVGAAAVPHGSPGSSYPRSAKRGKLASGHPNATRPRSSAGPGRVAHGSPKPGRARAIARALIIYANKRATLHARQPSPPALVRSHSGVMLLLPDSRTALALPQSAEGRLRRPPTVDTARLQRRRRQWPPARRALLADNCRAPSSN
jgi:hypothetical protein